MNGSGPLIPPDWSSRWALDLTRMYPSDAYYVFLANLIDELSRNVQAPGALIGLSVLSTIAMALQGLYDVRLPSGHVSPVSLYTAGIAASGERKSTLERLLARPIHASDEKQLKQHALDKAAYEMAFGRWKAENRRLTREIDKLPSGDERDKVTQQQIEHVRVQPVAPRRRHIVLENVTAASFMEAVDGDGESVAFHTPEGGTFLNGGAMDLMETLNKAWDGANLTFDRAHKRNLFARRPRVSISMMVQEAVLMMSVSKRGNLFRHSGHAARYLFANPPSKQGYRMQFLLDHKWECLGEFHRRLQDFLDQFEAKRNAGDLEHEVMTFSEDATKLWKERAYEVEGLIRTGGAWCEIRDFASKALEHTGRVAALLHKFCRQDGPISADTFARAWQIVSWHAEEFKRLFTEQPEELKFKADVETLTRHLHTAYYLQNMNGVPKNVLLRTGPLRPVSRLTAALDWMAAQNQVQVAPPFPRAPVGVFFNLNFFSSLGGRSSPGSSGLFTS